MESEPFTFVSDSIASANDGPPVTNRPPVASAEIREAIPLAIARSKREAAEILVESITDAFFSLDHQARFVFVNGAAEALLQCRQEHLFHRSFWEVFPAAANGAFHQQFHQALRHQAAVCFETDQNPFSPWLEISIYPHACGASIVLRDITSRKQAEAGLIQERKLAEQALALSEERLGFALAAGEEGFWDWNLGAGTFYVSKGWLEIFGLSAAQFAGSLDLVRQLCHPDDLNTLDAATAAALAGATPALSVEFRARHADGHYIWVLTRGKVVERGVQGEPVRVVGTNMDITRRKEMEEALWWRANHDSLTGLPNRDWLRERITSDLHPRTRKQGATGRAEPGALFVLDLDGFKYINDSIGHDVGDMVLKIVAKRLSETLSRFPVGRASLARLGGDEFVVWFPGGSRDTGELIRQAAQSAEEILNTLARPLRIESPAVGTRDLLVTASIGIAISPQDGTDMDSLLKSGDTALYQAKEHRRGVYRFHSHERSVAVSQRLVLEYRLRQAVSQSRMMLWYQPQVDLDTLRIIGVEALLRWHDEELGWVSPNVFVPLAEEIGLIQTLGEWVLRTACRQVAHWRATAHPTLRISVNLSALQLAEAGLGRIVDSVLAEAGLPGEALELELTETVLFRRREQKTTTFLHDVREKGVRLAIDDFGTGYSSLAYLRGLPVDVVKIDREFMSDLPDNRQTQAIVRAIIDLAHALGLWVMAEGVESEEQRFTLTMLNCDAIQGYLFSQPVSADDLEKQLRHLPWQPRRMNNSPSDLSSQG